MKVPDCLYAFGDKVYIWFEGGPLLVVVYSAHWVGRIREYQYSFVGRSFFVWEVDVYSSLAGCLAGNLERGNDPQILGYM